MLNKKALLVAREALWVRRRERFKQLVDFKILTPPTNNAMLEDARAAIEAYLAVLPDEKDGLASDFYEARQRYIELPDGEFQKQAALDMMAAGEKLADALEAARARIAAAPEPPDKPDG